MKIIWALAIALFSERASSCKTKLDYNEADDYYFEYRIKHSTITCSYISSVSDISYDYKETNYPQFLQIRYSIISTLPTSGLSQFTTITKLYLSQNHVKVIRPGAFNGMSRLEELYLDQNELTELTKGVLNYLHKLKILNLSDNQIHTIENYSFMGADSLKELYLGNNNLSVIEKGVFQTLEVLKYLDLSGNAVQEFYIGDIKLSNVEMEVLNMSSNYLTTVDFFLFPRIKEIDLTNNEISFIEGLEHFSETTVVKLDNNRIRNINGTFKGVLKLYLSYNQLEALGSALFNKDKEIEIIDLSFNALSTVASDVFAGLDFLTQLFLQHNNMSKIDRKLFADLTKLTILNLSHNKIEELQFGTFNGLTSLQILDISNNKLVDLHQYVYVPLVNLKNLYFDDNLISSFDVKDLKNHVSRLQLVSLKNNPWKCEDLVHIYHFFEMKNVTLSKGNSYDVDNLYGIACNNQKEIRGSPKYVEHPADDVSKSVSKIFDGLVKNSKMNQFFNGDFQNSDFVQYFKNGYRQSNFFRFLTNYKLSWLKKEPNETQEEKLWIPAPVRNDNDILIFSCVVQTVMAVSLFVLIYLVILRKVKQFQNRQNLTQMELS